MFINEGGGTRKRIDDNSSSDESDRANTPATRPARRPATSYSSQR